MEPLTSYSVVRARREFANQSSLGLHRHRHEPQPGRATRFLPGQAYTGGIDWDWRLAKRLRDPGLLGGEQRRAAMPQAIAELQESNVHSFQRPDATHLEYDPTRTSLNGYGGAAALSKIGGQRVALQQRTSR